MKLRIVTAAALLVLLGGFSKQKVADRILQPADERNAQDALPKSQDPMWKLLGGTVIRLDEKKGVYSAHYTPEVKALVGKQVTVQGFILPLDTTEKFKHFILSKRTPTCPFCPPGAPNEIIEVWSDTPLGWDERLFKVTGTFGLTNQQELGMFFKLTHAKVN